MKHGWTRRLLSILMAIAMLFCLLPTAVAADSGFADMPSKDHWAYEALSSAVEHGLLQGAGGKLLPEGVLTRAQMAAVVNRAFGAKDVADISGFADVPAGAWYHRDIAKAVRMGTLKGGSNGQMAPEANITREQAFTVLARAFRLEGGSADALKDFSDAAQVSGYAAGPLAAMVEAGYVSGSGGKLQPGASITRQEFAQVFYNMLRNYITKAGTYTEDCTGNVIVNVPGVVLKDAKISGDLIIGEGVGDGDMTLDNVQLTGRLVVRGGGEHSIIIRNKTSVGNVIVNKTGDGGVRLRTEDGCRVEVVQIDDGKDDVILHGEFNQVKVTSDAPVVLRDAVVAEMTVTGENAAVSTQGATEVAAVKIEESAAGAKLTVSDETKIAVVDTKAEKVSIDGSGKVDQVNVSGNDTAVDVSGASVTAAENTTGVTAGKQEVKPDTTVVAPSTDTGTSTGGGTGGGGSRPGPSGGGSTPSRPSTTASVSSVAALKAALGNNNIKTINITSDLEINEFLLVEGDKTVNIAAEKTVTVSGGMLFTGSGAKLVNNGTLVSNADCMEMKTDPEGNQHPDYKQVQLENGKYTNVDLCFASGASLVNNGTIESESSFSLLGATATNAEGAVINIRLYYSEEIDGTNGLNIHGATFVNDGTLNNEGYTFMSTWSPFIWTEEGPDGEPLYGLPTEENLPSTFTNNGVINNTLAFRVFAYGASGDTDQVTLSHLVNNGTIHSSGESSISASANLTNNGTIVNESYFEVFSSTWTYADGVKFGPYPCALNNAGTITTSGTLNVLRLAALNNTGTVTNNGRFHVTGTLRHTGGKFENSRSMYLTYGGTLDLTGAPAGSFVNAGYMQVADEYDAPVEYDENNAPTKTDNVLCTLKLGEAFNLGTENSDWGDYVAVVYSDKGFAAANAAQAGKTGEGPFGRYNNLDIVADMTITEDVNLDSFDTYWVEGQWVLEELVPATLTVAEGASLTVAQGNWLQVVDGGTLAVEGTLTTQAETPDDPETEADESIPCGGVDIWPKASFNSTGTVQNNGEFVVHYEEGWNEDGTYTGNYDRSEPVTGVPDNVEKTAVVHSAQGLAKAAGDETISSIEFKSSELGECELELTEALTLAKSLYIEPSNTLIVAHGATLTLAEGFFNNEGDIAVEGELVIDSGASLENRQNITVGAVTGSETASITVKGSLSNWNHLQVFPTGSIQLVEGSRLEGDAPVDAEGNPIMVTCDLTTLSADGDYPYYANVRFTKPLTITTTGNPNDQEWCGIDFENCVFAEDVTVQTDGSNLNVNMTGCTLAQDKGIVTAAADGAEVDMYSAMHSVLLRVPDGTKVQANVPTGVTLNTAGSFTLNGVTIIGQAEGEGDNIHTPDATIQMNCNEEHPEDYTGDHTACANVSGAIQFGGPITQITFDDETDQPFAEKLIDRLMLCNYFQDEGATVDVEMTVHVNRPDGSLAVCIYDPGCTITVTGEVTNGLLWLDHVPAVNTLNCHVTATDPGYIDGAWSNMPQEP